MIVSKSKSSILLRSSWKKFYRNIMSHRESNLKYIIKEIEKLAPITNAEPWDNVGLLIEPFTPKIIRNIFLTNDLTEPVVMEAVGKNADLIISYHPPIFAPLKSITQRTWKERIVSICLENRIALYSPHTAWDVTKNGVNDWLASSLPHTESKPIKPSADCPDSGVGRIITINDGITTREAIDKIIKHLGTNDMSVAIGNGNSFDTLIKTVAICAGSGGSVLKNVSADMYLTGEMSHHEILDATQQNITVLLSNHSNSERGYLKVFKERLEPQLKACEVPESYQIILSEKDHDPLVNY